MLLNCWLLNAPNARRALHDINRESELIEEFYKSLMHKRKRTVARHWDLFIFHIRGEIFSCVWREEDNR